ncbi:MAG: Uma2 family endonuclease, partial [Gemmataceae bacterium]
NTGEGMTTILKLGPVDHGRVITPDEARIAHWQEGYRYEIIDGKIYVSSFPELSHDFILQWIFKRVNNYSRQNPHIFNYVTTKGKVIVPDRPELTEPEPDLIAFHGFPLDLPIAEARWEDLTPVLVIEILSEDDSEKDLERNVELYQEIAPIREYWIFDPRTDADHPTLQVYRRRGRRWQKPIQVPFCALYTTRLLPAFSLRVDPHS